jgi:hypothetical protein
MTENFSSITRRDFLRLTAKGAIVSSGLLSGCAAAAPGGAKVSRAIDIHHH